MIRSGLYRALRPKRLSAAIGHRWQHQPQFRQQKRFLFSDGYKPEPTSLLHPSLIHPTMVKWQESGDGGDVQPEHLMYPIFISEDPDAMEPIGSLPGQYRWGVNRLNELMDPLVAKGLQSVLLFGVVTDDSKKDAVGSFASTKSSPVPKALRYLRERYPSVLLSADVCLCGYTHHGHCGVLNEDGLINNPQSIARLADISVSYAKAGASLISPSDMMDGRIGAIKHALEEAGLAGNTAVMSYSAKFASHFYGPFRDAAASSVKGGGCGDRSKYQLPPMGRRIAMRAIERDVEEGADMVMVKPGQPYLDIVRECRDTVNLPVAIYQVSGEYAMLHHGATAGAFELEGAVMESLRGMRRAGSDVLITYFAPLVLDWLDANKRASLAPPQVPDN